jgi:hypothetical protein
VVHQQLDEPLEVEDGNLARGAESLPREGERANAAYASIEVSKASIDAAARLDQLAVHVPRVVFERVSGQRLRRGGRWETGEVSGRANDDTGREGRAASGSGVVGVASHADLDLSELQLRLVHP